MTTVCTFSNLLTAKQVILVYGFAGMTVDKIPAKGKQTVLVPAGQVFYRITKSEFKSDTGGRLYRVEHLQNFEIEQVSK